MAGDKEFYLGVDGGGTTSRAAVVDSSGKVMVRAEGGGVNIHARGKELAGENFRELVRLMATKFTITKSCLALAGVDTQQDERVWREMLSNLGIARMLGDLLVVNDAVAAFRAGTDKKTGMVLIAGTGVNCYGFVDGRVAVKAGDWDWLAGDQGSGFWQGQRALQAVFMAIDGRGEKTQLFELIKDHLKVADMAGLYQWAYQIPFDKRRVADLAVLVGQAAQAGDGVAGQIIDEAVSWLFLAVKTVKGKMSEKGKGSLSLVLHGGLVEKEETLTAEKLKEKISQELVDLEMIFPQLTADVGAALVAREGW